MNKFQDLKQSKSNFLKSLVLTVIFSLSGFSLYAQNGSIKGVIIDANTKEPLIGAAAMIKGTTIGGASNLDGEFIIENVKPGKYTIVSSYISYKPFNKENITVVAGKETVVNIDMEPAGIALKEVELVAKSNRESENILLMEQKQSLIATQAVGSKEMSRKGISNAETAVMQVSGISKQDGVKNVFVRGLGDRSNFTTLNGFPIPSEDPEYKNISLDFFGSDIIQNIGVNKAFSSNNYCDASGAVIDISSKELVGDKELSIDLSAGLNSQIFGTDFLKTDGVNYWGVTTNIQPGKSNYRTIYNYGNSLDPQSFKTPFNSSYGFSAGKSYKVGEKSNLLSFYLVGSYSSGYSYSSIKKYDTQNDGTVYQDLVGKKSSQNINQLLLGNVSFNLNKKHQFSYNFLMIHDNNQNVREYTGYDGEFVSSLQPQEYEYHGFILKQKINENTLIVNQLISDFKLNEKFNLNAGIAYNSVIGNEPDRRENKFYQIGENEYKLLAGDGAHLRNYTQLNENDLNAKIKLSYKLPEKFKKDASIINIGYNGRFLSDNFIANEYSSIITGLNEVSTINNPGLDNSFNQTNYDNKKFVGAARFSEYQVLKMINSAFIGLDYQFSPKFSGNFGLRADQVYLNVDYSVQGGYNGTGSQVRNPFFILPSANLKYNLNDKNSFRFGLSKTYTLPQSKEISPYQHNGDDFYSQGNPNLIHSDNYNVDLKWDYYPSPSELISLNGFYKYIKNPIARVYETNGAGYFTYDNISDHATVAGIEMEIRKNIINKVNSNIEKVNKLSTGLNASYIYSNMYVEVQGSLPKYSALEGAAPYIANFDITYEYTFKNTSFVNALVLNYLSDRVYTIGAGDFKDVVEKGIPTMNFVSTYKMNKNLSFKLKAKNILDPSFELTREATDGSGNKVLTSYKKGVDISLGISYNFN